MRQSFHKSAPHTLRLVFRFRLFPIVCKYKTVNIDWWSDNWKDAIAKLIDRPSQGSQLSKTLAIMFDFKRWSTLSRLEKLSRLHFKEIPFKVCKSRQSGKKCWSYYDACHFNSNNCLWWLGSITIKLNGFFYDCDDIGLISVYWWIEVLLFCSFSQMNRSCFVVHLIKFNDYECNNRKNFFIFKSSSCVFRWRQAAFGLTVMKQLHKS